MTDTISAFLSNSFRLCRLGLAMCLLSTVAHGQNITKCQDEDGNWHYGDFASEICSEQSTVTEIDQRGNTIKESEAPPTEEELEAREATRKAQELEAERQAQQAEDERRLLRTYDDAQSIMDARDNRIEALERDLESYRLFRQDLINEKDRLGNENDKERIDSLEQQIRQYNEAIETLEREQRETAQEFNRELEIYRELTNEDEEQPETGE